MALPRTVQPGFSGSSSRDRGSDAGEIRRRRWSAEGCAATSSAYWRSSRSWFHRWTPQPINDPAPNTMSPPTPSSQKWLPVTTMQNSVVAGYSSTSALTHLRRSSGQMAMAHQVDQPMCRARHRRILVRDRCHRLGVERPRTTEVGERVDESETALRAQVAVDALASVADAGADLLSDRGGQRARFVEQARWHQRKPGESDDGEGGHRGERVPPLREHVGSTLEQQHEHRERDDEVGGAVVRVPELDEPLVGEEP